MNAEKTHESLVILGDLAALAGSLYLLWKLYNTGDKGRLIEMRFVRAASKFSKVQSEWWSQTAAKFDTAYIKLAS